MKLIRRNLPRGIKPFYFSAGVFNGPLFNGKALPVKKRKPAPGYPCAYAFTL
jgi:hypothetical protein